MHLAASSAAGFNTSLLERPPVLLAQTGRGMAFGGSTGMGPLVSSEVRAEWKHQGTQPGYSGERAPFDLGSNPVITLTAATGTVRLHIAQATLDDLADASAPGRRGSRLAPSSAGLDHTMHRLAEPLFRAVAQPGMFADYAALVFHVHVLRTYGSGMGQRQQAATGLAPWQARRAQDFLVANLEGDPSIASVAAECRLSTSHFARAFKQTTGLPPHRWLTRQRLLRAKSLMEEGRTALAEIAVACGFVDQSHFTRVFAASERQSPAKWQRGRHGSAAIHPGAGLAC